MDYPRFILGICSPNSSWTRSKSDGMSDLRSYHKLPRHSGRHVWAKRESLEMGKDYLSDQGFDLQSLTYGLFTSEPTKFPQVLPEFDLSVTRSMLCIAIG
jgi:hypothetical protein